MRINSRGLRDREYDYEKPAGVRRILVLGDSYAWGFGVGDDEIFSEVMERELAPAWQVINAGVSGWGTDQEYLFFQLEGFRYSPDIVVLAFFLGNDPVNNSSSQQYGLNKPVFLGRNLKLANSPVPWPGEKPLVLPPKSYDQQLQTTLDLFAALDRSCREQQCQLVIMKFGAFAYPDNAEFASFERRFESAFAGRFQTDEHRIHYLDLDKPLAAADKPILRKGDDHWNPFGHRLTADYLLQFLRAARLVRTDNK